MATGYGAIESDGNRHSLLEFGVLKCPASLSFPEKLLHIHTRLLEIIEHCRPDRMAVESLFYAANVKSALKLGHVRGVALVAGVSKGLPIDEYSPLEIKQAVVGYGRADKAQVQNMVGLLLGLDTPPAPHDAADALAVALCHAHRLRFAQKIAAGRRNDEVEIVIGHLRGTLLAKKPGQVLLEVGGVGYKVFIPLSTYYELDGVGTAVALRVITHVREDTFALYGFLTEVEELLFEKLVSVAGVGPSLGLKVLSGLEPRELVDAIRTRRPQTVELHSRRREEDRGTSGGRAQGQDAAGHGSGGRDRRRRGGSFAGGGASG